MEVSVLLGEQDFPEGEAWAAAVLLDVSRDGREELGHLKTQAYGPCRGFAQLLKRFCFQMRDY